MARQTANYEKPQECGQSTIAKPYNQIEEQERLIEKLQAENRQQQSELLALYRRIHGQEGF